MLCWRYFAATIEYHSEIARRILQARAWSGRRTGCARKDKSHVVDALASLAAIVIDRHQSFEKEERAETASKASSCARR